MLLFCGHFYALELGVELHPGNLRPTMLVAIAMESLCVVYCVGEEPAIAAQG